MTERRMMIKVLNMKDMCTTSSKYLHSQSNCADRTTLVDVDNVYLTYINKDISETLSIPLQ